MKKMLFLVVVFAMHYGAKAQITSLTVVNNTCFNLSVNAIANTVGACTSAGGWHFGYFSVPAFSTSATISGTTWGWLPSTPSGSWEFEFLPYNFDDGSGTNCGSGVVDNGCAGHTVDTPPLCGTACHSSLKVTWSTGCKGTCATVTATY